MKKENKDKKELIGKALQLLIKNPGKSLNLITKTSDGIGEDNTGTYLTYQEMLLEILKANYAEGTVFERTIKIPVSDKANGIIVPIVDQSTRSVSGGILGGILPIEVTEGTAITKSKPAFKQTPLELNQIGVAVTLTNAILQDTSAIAPFLSNGLTEGLRFWIDRNIIYGSGLGTGGIGKFTAMNGVGNPACAIGCRATKFMTVANPYTVTNIREMVKEYYGGEDGVWVMGHTAYHEIIDLYSSSTYPMFPLIFNPDGTQTLFGYKIIHADFMDARDILLGDFSQYVTALKPIREGVNEYLYWLTNQTSFKAVARINGCPIWSGPIREQDADINYCYVMARPGDTESSSSTSSQSSDSSSSSSESSDTSSSNSSGSKSSGSSGSQSSGSSGSLSSDSTSSSTSSSQSSGAHGPCLEQYTASGFATSNLNGKYYWAGRYNSKAYYTNANSKVMFWANAQTLWAIANTLGAAPGSWLSNSSAARTCPAGAMVDETGTIS